MAYCYRKSVMNQISQTKGFNKIIWLVFLLVPGWPTHSLAWGPEAHRIVGLIADQHLLPEVRFRIKRDFNISSLANVANWADWVKGKKSQGPWHYANILEGERTYLQRRDCPSGECVVAKVREFSAKLARSGSSLKGQLEALKYLVHFVADLHQPLHLGNRTDRGGNKIRIIFRGRETNLHALWDSGLVNTDEDNLLPYALRLAQRVSPTDKLLWVQPGSVDWANESREQALDVAYDKGIMSTGILTKAYIQKARDIIELRLSQAGVRLAHLLNTRLN